MPIEPSADMRAMAQALMEAYNAFIEVGFTDTQAILIVCEMIANQAKGESS